MKRIIPITLCLIVAVSLAMGAVTDFRIAGKPNSEWFRSGTTRDIGWRWAQEVNDLLNVTPGTATASKAVVLDDDKAIDGFVVASGGSIWFTPHDVSVDANEGRMYSDLSEHTFKQRTNSAWVAMGSGTFTGGSITSDAVLANGKYVETATTATNTGGVAAYNTSTSKYYPVFKATAGTAAGTMATTVGDANAVLTIVSSGGLNVGATGDMTGVGTIAASGDTTYANGKGIKSSTTTAQTVGVYAYDVDGTTYRAGVLGTNGNSPPWVFGNAYGTTTLTSSDWGIDATGTVTGIASVQFDSGTTIYCDSVTVSNAEVKTLFSSPKVLVAAPGTHNFIDVVSVVLFYDYATAAFNTAANNITVEYKADASGPTATSAISQTGFLDQTVDGVGKLIPVAVANQVVAAVENQPVVLYCATADPTTGGGVVRVAISYRKMPTGF
jgi:hypothetical protein